MDNTTNINFDWIEEQICDIMRHYGPDGHTDGSHMIASFIIALLNNNGDKWLSEYKQECKLKDKARKNFLKQFDTHKVK